MKLRNLLFINCIVSTEKEDVLVKKKMAALSSADKINPSNNSFEVSRKDNELNNAIKSIINYICNVQDRILIKNNVLSNIKSFLSLKNTNEKQRNAMISIQKKIENDNIFQFSQNEFNHALVYYYEMNYGNNLQDQVNINKRHFEEILTLRKDIKTLCLRLNNMLKNDICNLIEAMRKHIQDLVLISPSNLDLLIILNKIDQSVELPIKLLIINYKYISKYHYDILKLLNYTKITSLMIINCDLGTSKYRTFFKPICDNKYLERLTLVNINLIYADVEYILNSLEENKTLLNVLCFDSVNISKDLFYKLLDGLKTNKKLKSLFILNMNITPTTAKKISNIIEGDNNIQELIIKSDQIDKEHIDILAEGLKVNKKLIYIKISSKKITIKDIISIFNAILKNSESKIQRLYLDGREDLFNTASDEERKVFSNTYSLLQKKIHTPEY